MTIQKIYNNGKLLAMLIRNDEWKQGLNFVSKDDDYLQVGLWCYEKGKNLLPHRHLLVERKVYRTQEVIFVKNGVLKVDIYSEEDAFVDSVELSCGDILILFFGGHGYEILENGTQVLEVKNGPYVGAEKDRKRI